ncbi:hypothetical protein [Psychrobacter sp. DM4]|uniref:hypothetical protein n=1 Tax=Psychrobacter sp. DM4 TaxID=3440637 RepID=UPI003F4F457E
MKSKLTIAVLVLLFLSGLSGLLESVLYNDVNTDGVLQESFFLPLSFMLAILAVGLCILSIATKIISAKPKV